MTMQDHLSMLYTKSHSWLLWMIKNFASVNKVYVSNMYVACAVRFISHVEQISEIKIFSEKNFLDLFIIWSLKIKVSRTSWLINSINFPDKFPIKWRIYSQSQALLSEKSQFKELSNISDKLHLTSLWSSKTPQHSSLFLFFLTELHKIKL